MLTRNHFQILLLIICITFIYSASSIAQQRTGQVKEVHIKPDKVLWKSTFSFANDNVPIVSYCLNHAWHHLSPRSYSSEEENEFTKAVSGSFMNDSVTQNKMNLIRTLIISFIARKADEEMIKRKNVSVQIYLNSKGEFTDCHIFFREKPRWKVSKEQLFDLQSSIKKTFVFDNYRKWKILHDPSNLWEGRFTFAFRLVKMKGGSDNLNTP